MVSTDLTSRAGADRATDQYGRILLLLLAIMWSAMFLEQSRPARVLVGYGVIAVVLMSLRATGVTRQTMRIALLVALALTLLVAVGGFTDTSSVLASTSLATAAALTVSIVVLVRRIFEQPKIGVSEIIAALAAYLQIAFVFAFMYTSATGFADTNFFNGGIRGDAGDFLYFSVVTLTSLGYGDLSPATSMGRSLAMTEALLGQIFLVVLVAYLVGMLGTTRQRVRGGS